MSDQLGWAESNLDDTACTIDTVLAYAKLIKNETDDTSSRLRALFRQDTREDPIRERERTKLAESLVEQISKSKKLTKPAPISTNSVASPSRSQPTLRQQVSCPHSRPFA